MLRWAGKALWAALAAGGLLWQAGTTSVADTQWYGTSYGMTYRTADGAGVWGGTYDDTYAVYKEASLWTESRRSGTWWYNGRTFDSGSGWEAAETSQWHGVPTRGATDHAIPGWARYWTTSDGF